MKDYKTRPGSKGRKPGTNRTSPPRGGRRRGAFQKSYPQTESAIRGIVQAYRGAVGGAYAAVRPWLHPRHLPRAVFLLCAGWLAAGLAVGGHALWRMPLEKVALAGNSRLEGRALLERAGLRAGLAMSRVDPFQVARRVAAHPQVRHADARRVFPGLLALRIRERRPELRVRMAGGMVAVVDRDNVVLHLTGEGAGKQDGMEALPMVHGGHERPMVGAPLAGGPVRSARRLLALLARYGFSETGRMEVDTTAPFRSRVIFPGGQTLILPPAAPEAALEAYRTVIANQPELLQGRAWIDLTSLTPGGLGRIVAGSRPGS